jgi:GMP synthase-like glutamine amidotransferase
MKILLVDNNTKHFKSLTRALAGHDVEIQRYKPKIDFHHLDKDLIILSGGGGEGFEIDDKDKHGKLWYENQMNFIRNADKPVIGICMGFEVMAKAYGQEVPQLNGTVSRSTNINTTEHGWNLFDKHNFQQVESHSWYVPEAPEGFLELARSTDGTEMIFNPDRRQVGVQFHPELPGSLRIHDLIHLVHST